MERTYIMLKPDALKRGVAGEIISRIERKGYKIVEAKTMQLGEAVLKEHYAHIADKPFFQRPGFGNDCGRPRRGFGYAHFDGRYQI